MIITLDIFKTPQPLPSTGVREVSAAPFQLLGEQMKIDRKVATASQARQNAAGFLDYFSGVVK